MKLRTVIIIGLTTVLAGCVAGIGIGNNRVAQDSYFAANVGRLAGRAEAIAALCPTLTFNPVELELNRVAICEAEGEGESCGLPKLDAEKEKSFTETLASLNGIPAEQICADARAEAASDYAFADFLTGLQVARPVAVIRAAAPVPAEPVVEEPTPEEPAPDEPLPEEPAPEATPEAEATDAA